MALSTTPKSESQYTLAQILGIWVAAALPMAILGWVVAPALAPDFTADPIGAGAIRVGALSVGLIWQFVLAMIMIHREEGNLRWATIRQRGRLNMPRHPGTGEPRPRLVLWLIPILILLAALTFFVLPTVDRLWVGMFPFLSEPPGFALNSLLDSPAIQAELLGAWWFFGLFLTMAVFNTIVGEEFLFRGVLLPKMNGVCGKWDWVANGVLFGTYHWHQPWMIPSSIITGALCFALPARRFHTTWMAIIAHSVEAVFFLVLILGIVLGLA